jgi:hypothetical protein
MSELVSDINVQLPQAAGANLRPAGGELDSIIARISRMAKANPWAGKECDEIIKSLRVLCEVPNGGPRAASNVMNSRSFKTRVVEDLPESRLVIEAGAERTGVRYEVDLVDRRETTDVKLRVEVTEASPVEAQSALLAVVRDLASFEQGYQARVRTEYFEPC